MVGEGLLLLAAVLLQVLARLNHEVRAEGCLLRGILVGLKDPVVRLTFVIIVSVALQMIRGLGAGVGERHLLDKLHVGHLLAFLLERHFHFHF